MRQEAGQYCLGIQLIFLIILIFPNYSELKNSCQTEPNIYRMNLLLFDQEELAGNFLKLSGRRAEHILHVLELHQDDILKVGMINGNIGTARVVSTKENMVELEVHLAQTKPEEPLIELILALPRPIMLQRILKQATVLGVRRFHLIRSNRVQKSFFQTNLLHPEKLRKILIQGLEQTVDTNLPEVLVHQRFMPFIEDIVPTLKSPCRLLADPNEHLTLPDLYSAGKISGSFSLAIGPEGGWSQHEVRQFAQAGFHCFAMGSRILHVDTAVVALLSQIQLLHDLGAFDKDKLSIA